ncbi:MAG TPA: disulfide bond formation protein B [Patescibacteria group bacterium]
MSQLTSTVTTILSVLTIIGQVFIGLAIIWLLIYRFKKEQPVVTKVLNFFDKRAVLFSLIVALLATLGSLFYSEIAGFEPCRLCWYQRILMYPQVILLALALWIRDKKNIVVYSLGLSIVGAVIAGYHYLLQIGVVKSSSCEVVGYSVSCSQRFVMNFGYITIPMMALTAFGLIIVFMIIKKLASSRSYE